MYSAINSRKKKMFYMLLQGTEEIVTRYVTKLVKRLPIQLFQLLHIPTMPS